MKKVIVQGRQRDFWEQLSKPTMSISTARKLLNLCREGANRELYFRYKSTGRIAEIGNCWNEFRIITFKGEVHRDGIRRGLSSSIIQ